MVVGWDLVVVCCLGLLAAAAFHGGFGVLSFDLASCLVATDVRPRQRAGFNDFVNHVVTIHRLIQVMDSFTDQPVTASRKEFRP